VGGLSPNSAIAGNPVSLTVNGSGFQSGATVEWNRTPASTTFVSPTQLRATVPAAQVSPPGTVSVVVTNPGGVTSNTATFTVTQPSLPPPAITSVSPNAVQAGGPAFNIVVNGSGFAPKATVHWKGSPLQTTFESPAQLRASVPANLSGSAGVVSVTVVNPGNITSGSVNFTVNPATPAISGLSPNSVAAGGPGFSLVVSGSAFQAGAVVHWRGKELPTTFAGPSQLTATVPANLIGVPGTAAITVVNPGNATSAVAPLVITPAVPRTDPDVELVKAAVMEYAAAYSGKDFDKVAMLYPQMPKDTKAALQDAFKKADYKVNYTIQLTAPPVVRGDDASVTARTLLTQSYAKRESSPVTRTVVITLHKDGGRWTISAFR
jgi:ketosteroid isomerase-like protein